MAGMILKIVIASLVAFCSYFIFWWAPAIAFPVSFLFTPSFGANNSFVMGRSKLEVRRTVFYSISTAFLIIMAVLFQMGLGSWYGWLVGVFLAWLGCGSIAADLEKYLCFRTRS